MTGQENINAALDLLGVLDPGESPNTSEATAALARINALIDSLSLERLNIPVIATLTHALVSGTATYTVGSGGTFSTTRPIRIERCKILVANAGGTGSLEFECKLVSFEEWADIIEKSSTAVVPTKLYYDYGYPTGNLNFNDVPTFSGTAPQAQLYVWAALNSFPDLTTNINFPQGYDRAITALSAIEIAPMFSVAPSATLLQNAAEAKAALRALNATPQGQPAPMGPLNAVPAPAPPPAVAP